MCIRDSSSITGKGRITLVEEEKEKEEGLRRIACQVGAEVKFLPEVMEKVNVYRLDAVSYTHLDVYKRRLFTVLTAARFPFRKISCP